MHQLGQHSSLYLPRNVHFGHVLVGLASFLKQVVLQVVAHVDSPIDDEGYLVDVLLLALDNGLRFVEHRLEVLNDSSLQFLKGLSIVVRSCG